MTLKKRPAMHISWFEALQSEFNEEYMEDLRNFLIDKKSKNEVIYPPSKPISSIRTIAKGTVLIKSLIVSLSSKVFLNSW